MSARFSVREKLENERGSLCLLVDFLLFSSDCFSLSNFVKRMLHGKFWDACFDLINRETIEY